MKDKILKISCILLSSLMGLLFIYSGWSKLYPIEPFEYTFVDLGIGDWKIAPFIARFLIGMEFFLGLMLFFNLYLKRFTIQLTALILLVFVIYLSFIIVKNGNNGNCGCFGEMLPMTPRDAIIKNLVMLGICFVIYKFHEGFSFGKLTMWLSVLFLLTSLVMPHILNYVDLSYSQAYLDRPEYNFKLELDTLYNNAKVNKPPVTLSEGKHIISFMSLTCPHCRMAAKKIRIMHERNPAIPFYFVLNGNKEDLKKFYEDTHSEDIPYCMLGARPFVFLGGTALPAIYMVNNSIVEHSLSYINLDQSEIEKWLEKK